MKPFIFHYVGFAFDILRLQIICLLHKDSDVLINEPTPQCEILLLACQGEPIFITRFTDSRDVSLISSAQIKQGELQSSFKAFIGNSLQVNPQNLPKRS